MNVPEFQEKWRGVELKERSAAQEHYLDLCRVLGMPTPADVDKTGSFYTFEKGAEKKTGGNGFADVWFQGHFAWEYKGPPGDLINMYTPQQQLGVAGAKLKMQVLISIRDKGATAEVDVVRHSAHTMSFCAMRMR